jgi:hypothetical protein
VSLCPYCAAHPAGGGGTTNDARAGLASQPPEQLARKLPSSTANVSTIGQVTPAIPEQGEKVGSINGLIITPDHSLWYEVLDRSTSCVGDLLGSADLLWSHQ